MVRMACLACEEGGVVLIPWARAPPAADALRALCVDIFGDDVFRRLYTHLQQRARAAGDGDDGPSLPPDLAADIEADKLPLWPLVDRLVYSEDVLAAADGA